ncbi:hypothetical protein [Vibrio metschnikovii]|uniref:hypothetical protein n=1 Tax=Vibrio metschnikovii TaxID=28172 RepID=UPI001302D104|nr:hypothetical protein [Vibrio metschnikovii]
MDTELARKMIARADADNLPDVHKLRSLAWDFEKSALSIGQPGGLKRMLGCWARAKRCWSEYTGEPLL